MSKNNDINVNDADNNKDNAENDFSLVFVSYFFKRQPEHKIIVKPHGNTKNSTVPYLCTYKSTRTKLKSALEETISNKHAAHKVANSVRGLA